MSRTRPHDRRPQPGHGPEIVLTGPPGAGKTAVGRALARRLAVPFNDVDSLIVDRAGKSVSAIFADEGEGAFRALELRVVRDALCSAEGVLALGGGSVLADQTRARLLGHRVVYLSVGRDEGLRRTSTSRDRPLLVGGDPGAAFDALLQARTRLYRDVASVEVDTGGRSVEEVASAALAALGRDRTAA